MKILFLLPHFKLSGGVRIILNYAAEFSKKGHDVSVYSINKTWTRYLKTIYYRHSFISHASRVKFRQVKNFKDLPSSDVIVADSWHVIWQIKDLNLKTKIFHFIQHDERLYHGPVDQVDQVYRLPYPKIVISSWLKEIFKNDYNVDAELLLNPIDLNLFKPKPREKSLTDVRILLLHHTYLWKGTLEGVNAVQILKNKYPLIKLILFGSRAKKINYPCDEYYYKLAQDKLSWLYSNSDIYLCPSWDEGSGLPSMEAMACGCAVVTYDNGGSRDYAIDGKTALVAKRRDQNDFQNKLEILVKDIQLRKNIAQNGYQFIKQMPSLETQAEKLEKIINA